MTGQKNLPREQTVRSFIALHPDPAVRERIADVLRFFRALPSRVKWESTSNLHITAKFLGDATRDALKNIESGLRHAALPERFSATLDVIGCFPNKRNPRIVWIGFSHAPKVLYSIAEASEEAAEREGFERERKPFHPHMTLGRVKGDDGLTDLQNALSSFTFEPFDVQFNAISIMKSELRPTGSVYTELATIPLK